MGIGLGLGCFGQGEGDAGGIFAGRRMRRVRGKGEGFEDKFSIGSGRMYRELGVLFWEHLPSWIDAGSVRPLGYEVVEGLGAERVNEALDGCMCILTSR